MRTSEDSLELFWPCWGDRLTPPATLRVVGLGAKRPDQLQAAGRIREDANHSGAALDLLVEPFEQID